MIDTYMCHIMVDFLAVLFIMSHQLYALFALESCYIRAELIAGTNISLAYLANISFAITAILIV